MPLLHERAIDPSGLKPNRRSRSASPPRPCLTSRGGRDGDEVPRLWARKTGMAAAISCRTARRFTSIIWSQSASSLDSSGALSATPATLASTSRCPNRCMAKSTRGAQVLRLGDVDWLVSGLAAAGHDDAWGCGQFPFAPGSEHD